MFIVKERTIDAIRTVLRVFWKHHQSCTRCKTRVMFESKTNLRWETRIVPILTIQRHNMSSLLVVLDKTLCLVKQHAQKKRSVGNFSYSRRAQHKRCLTHLSNTKNISPSQQVLSAFFFTKDSPFRTAIAKLPMTKSKRSTPRPRPTPYPTPGNTTNPNYRSNPAATQVSDARFFPHPPRFAFTTAYPQNTLTPYEDSQTLEEFCRDLQENGARTVDEGRNVGSAGIRNHEGFDERASENAEGERSESRREGESEGVDQNGGVNWARAPTQRLDLSKRKGGRGTVYSPSDKGQSQPPTVPPKDLPPALGQDPLEQLSKPTEESSTLEPDLPPPDPLTEEQTRLAQLLEPVAEFNARTPWPTPFHAQSMPRPTWHTECPGGYEPTTLAGYPQRRQYPIYNSAAHDADIVRDESGHYCLDLDPWDQCLMGKCGGCEFCRP